jgi:hypothetical protein
MSAPPSQTQWYLARDGQQFGPLSDAELRKFIDLGHLQPSDLLWRDGFPDWRPATAVFPRKAAAPLPAGRRQMAPAVQPPFRSEHPGQGVPLARPAARQEGNTTPPAARRRLKLLLPGIVVLILVAWALYYGLAHRTRFLQLVIPSSGAPAASLTLDGTGLDVSPLVGFRGSPEAINAALQATPLWRVLKREFPDWYAERLKEAAALAAENKDDAAIGQQMARALVALRRQNVTHALAASFPKLKAVATSFYANLVELKKQSSDACFEFISQGEASATVVAFLQGSPHVAPLQAQLTAVFEAIADGRRAQRVYPQPKKADYEALTNDLIQRGWTQGDMQLFSDERALARAGSAKVCQMVHDWFAAQLAIKDPDMQLRLLVDSLKPVVAG